MIDQIAFDEDGATLRLEQRVPSSGIMPPADPDYVMRFPACERLRQLMPNVLRELAPGYLPKVSRLFWQGKPIEDVTDDVLCAAWKRVCKPSGAFKSAGSGYPMVIIADEMAHRGLPLLGEDGMEAPTEPVIADHATSD